jgi:tRNA threonylcarbamoyladenosine biosynthesis protein TsaB
MNEVYFAAYARAGASWGAVHEPRVCAPDALPAITGGDWMGCGSGFAVYGDILAARYEGKIVATDAERFPHARDIAALAAPAFAAGQARSAEHAIPVYIRDKVALRIDERANR